MNYLDFEIEVTPTDAGAYTARVLRSPAGEATSPMVMPFSGLALQNNLQALQIALLRSGTTRRRLDTPETKTVQKFGHELWQALFSGDILGRFEASRGEARRQGAGIRIKLRVDAPELAALPWEYLFDASRAEYVALSASTPLIRYIPLPETAAPLLVKPPLRVLGMVVSPSDLPPLDVDRERQRLDTALGDLTGRGLIDLVWMPGGTQRDLQQMLWKGPWHVFHFIGHGGFDEIRGEGLVVFQDSLGKAQRMSATSLGLLLGDHDPLRLAVLNACESARADEVDIFSSTAATLVRHGTPAVVAMQYEITDDAAIEFSRSFYEAVGTGIPVDTALAEARKGVAIANPGTLEWGTPVLFMRAPDGVLFQIPTLPAQPVAQPARPAPQPQESAHPQVAPQPAPAAAIAPPESRSPALQQPPAATAEMPPVATAPLVATVPAAAAAPSASAPQAPAASISPTAIPRPKVRSKARLPLIIAAIIGVIVVWNIIRLGMESGNVGSPGTGPVVVGTGQVLFGTSEGSGDCAVADQTNVVNLGDPVFIDASFRHQIGGGQTILLNLTSNSGTFDPIPVTADAAGGDCIRLQLDALFVLHPGQFHVEITHDSVIEASGDLGVQ